MGRAICSLRVVSVAEQGSLRVKKASASSELRAASYVRAYSFGTYPSDRSEYARRSHVQMTADGAWEQMESQLEKEGLDFFPMIAVSGTFDDAENLIAQGVHVNIPTETGMEYVLGTLDVTVGVKLPAEELVGTLPKESAVAARERAYLSNICVLSSARRQGIAQSLIETACLEAYTIGVRHMYVHVVDENTAAVRLYEDKCGFKIEKEEHASLARALNRPRRLILHKML